MKVTSHNACFCNSKHHPKHANNPIALLSHWIEFMNSNRSGSEKERAISKHYEVKKQTVIACVLSSNNMYPYRWRNGSQQMHLRPFHPQKALTCGTSLQCHRPTSAATCIRGLKGEEREGKNGPVTWAPHSFMLHVHMCNAPCNMHVNHKPYMCCQSATIKHSFRGL